MTIQTVGDITSFKWATVEVVSPLSIQLDGDTAPLALIPDSLVDPLELFVGARVRVELSLRKVVIHGVNDGGGLSGEIKAIAQATVPAGWLLANGQSLLRSDYPRLFAALGTTFGAADSTHFTLPDMRGKVVVGMDATQTEFNTRGKTGGEKTHVLTIPEMPNHAHTPNGASNFAVYGGGGAQVSPAGSVLGLVTSTAAVGGSGAHNNLQPYMALNYVIKI